MSVGIQRNGRHTIWCASLQKIGRIAVLLLVISLAISSLCIGQHPRFWGVQFVTPPKFIVAITYVRKLYIAYSGTNISQNSARLMLPPLCLKLVAPHNATASI